MKEIEESFFMTEKEKENFKFNNRGKRVKGTYNRLNIGKGKWKKFKGQAGVFVNSKGIWKDVKFEIIKGITKKHNPLVLGADYKK